MNKTNRPTWINLSKKNLVHNLNLLAKINGKNNFFCPMVKANAYGHGDLFVARTIERTGYDAIGVAMLEEGIHLRKHRIKIKNILVFEPILSKEHLLTCLKYKLIPILSDWQDFKFLDQIYKNKKTTVLRVHIKFNTGMNRLGFAFSDWQRVKQKLSQYKQLSIAGVFTHVHSGEDLFQPSSQTIEQFERFSEIEKLWGDKKVQFHAMNSVCLKALSYSNALKGELRKKYNFGGRPGIALYGIEPELFIPDEIKNKKDNWSLKPVLSWHTQIIQIHKIKKGEIVSYGARWKASQDTIIGVLPVGYADGYRRNLTNNAFVLIHDQRAPIVGTVCMDYTMVDLGSVQTECKIGDAVVLLGSSKNQKVDAPEWADRLKTNAYEVVTCISNRVPRITV